MYVSSVQINISTKNKILQQYKIESIGNKTIDSKDIQDSVYTVDMDKIKSNFEKFTEFANRFNKVNSNQNSYSIEELKNEILNTTREAERIQETIRNNFKNSTLDFNQSELYFYQLFNLENNLNSFSVEFDKLKSKDNLYKKFQELIKKIDILLENVLSQFELIESSKNSNKKEPKKNLSLLLNENNIKIQNESQENYFKKENKDSYLKVKLNKNGTPVKRHHSILKEIQFNFFVDKKNTISRNSDKKILNFFYKSKKISLEQFRKGIIGRNVIYSTPFGDVISLYADDTASARPHKMIEDYMSAILPMYANTHSDSSFFAVSTNAIYHKSEEFLLDYFRAHDNYVITSTGNGCTGAIYYFIDILSRKFQGIITDDYNEVKRRENLTDRSKIPVTFITEYEHHSNILSWIFKGFEVIPISNTANHNWELGLIDLNNKILQYKDRPLIVISTSAASNITTQKTPLKGISDVYLNAKKNIPEIKDKIVYCIDVAAFCSHETIDLNNLRPDAIFLSPHKLTGGPGSCGLLFFSKNIYALNEPPTKPSGGTVDLVFGYKTKDVIFSKDISSRETPGTPGILQFIRAALSFQLQQLVGLEVIRDREHELTETAFKLIQNINNKWNKEGYKSKIHILGPQNHMERLSTISCIFYDKDGNAVPFRLVHRVLSDFFGVQVRSGCNCAGPFGAYLLNIDKTIKDKAKTEISEGNFEVKQTYGWLRFNTHFSMTNEELYYLINSLSFIIENISIFKNNVYRFIDGEYRIQKEYPDFMFSNFKSSLHNFFLEFKFDLNTLPKSKFIEEEKRNDFLVNNFEETKLKIKKYSEYILLEENDKDKELSEDEKSEKSDIDLYN